MEKSKGCARFGLASLWGMLGGVVVYTVYTLLTVSLEDIQLSGPGGEEGNFLFTLIVTFCFFMALLGMVGGALFSVIKRKWWFSMIGGMLFVLVYSLFTLD